MDRTPQVGTPWAPTVPPPTATFSPEGINDIDGGLEYNGLAWLIQHSQPQSVWTVWGFAFGYDTPNFERKSDEIFA